MKWVDLGRLTVNLLPLKPLLLLSELLLNLEQWDLEETVEASLAELRHSPLNDYIDFLLFVCWLHLKFAHHKGLLLFVIVLFVSVFKDALDA